MSAHSMQAQLSLSRTELLRFRWLLGNLLALIALWALMDIDVPTMGLLGVTGLAVFVNTLRPSLAGHAPRVVWTVITPIALSILVVTDFFVSQPDIIPPLVRMLILLVLIRCLQHRRRREDLQLILLCLFMIMLVGVLTLSIAFGLQMLIFTPIAMGVLFLVTLTEPGGERDVPPEALRLRWDAFRWRPFLTRIWQAQNFRLLGLIAVLFFGVLAVSSLIFVMIPRFQINQAIPFLRLNSTKSLSGFSDRIHFGDIVDIIEDDGVALRVDVDTQGGRPMSPYWRMVVLDEYNYGSFQMSRSARARRTAARTYFFRAAGRPVEDGVKLRTWTFYLEGGISKFLPTVGSLNTMRFQNRQNLEINGSLKLVNTKRISSNVLFYQTESMILADEIPGIAQDGYLRGQAPLPVSMPQTEEDARIEYPYTTLVVPAGRRNLETLDAALRDITGGARLSARAFSRRTTAYLRKRHGYALQVALPKGDRDPLIRWLDSDRPGHCELFAGAFTLLARRAGYPTRIVTGFKGGTWNGYEHYYMVRNKNAHAWCEVYDGEDRWLRADPTPGGDALLPGANGAAAGSILDIDQTWGAYFDSLRILWYRRIVKFDRDQQRELAGHVRAAGAGMVAGARQRIRDAAATARIWIAGFRRGGLWMLGLRLMIFGAVVILVLRRLPRLMDRLSTLRIGRGGLSNPVRRKAGAFIRKFRAATPPSHAPEEWGIVYRHLLQIRFGDRSEWPDPYDVFRHARVLLKRMA